MGNSRRRAYPGVIPDVQVGRSVECNTGCQRFVLLKKRGFRGRHPDAAIKGERAMRFVSTRRFVAARGAYVQQSHVASLRVRNRDFGSGPREMEGRVRPKLKNW